MVTRRLRSEYMKKFKDPKWETYNKCYEDTLKYRLTRRLLEQTHNPWFWSGSDTDSDSGGRSPLPLSKVRPEAYTGACGDRLGPDLMVPSLPLQDDLEEVQKSAPHLVINGETGARGTQAQEERVCNGDKQLTITKNQKGNTKNSTHLFRASEVVFKKFCFVCHQKFPALHFLTAILFCKVIERLLYCFFSPLYSANEKRVIGGIQMCMQIHIFYLRTSELKFDLELN